MKSLYADAAAPRPSALITATSEDELGAADALARARAFAEPLIASAQLDTGENILAHADAVAAIVRSIGGSQSMQAACYLVYASEHLHKPHDAIAKGFGQSLADLALQTTKLVHLQRMARRAQQAQDRASAPLAQSAAMQTEGVRKMLLAFSKDLRVVLLRLASRMQTLRFYAASKRSVPVSLAQESLQVFAPLANRLGIWEIKWEMEDLAFRFLEPDTYRSVARMLDEKRAEREASVEALRQQLAQELQRHGIRASVQGRPKHIYSIVKKMRGKSLAFERVFDLRALRIVVDKVADCYAALSYVHELLAPVTSEFDDYIARPKPNGYQSLHTVVRDAAGKPIEVQIRTQEMHEHAEHGVAAHWVYKEAGAKGYAGVSASGAYEAKIAVLRQLLAWERDLASAQDAPAGSVALDEHIYVLTPDAAIVELPQGATPVDFAYSVHTSLGHRCRGAKVDGAMVPLQTPLRNGQTVEISAAKDGGPSRDWLNPELGYLASHRARSKVRAWFNALAMAETVARGREAVERLLQREGRTALALDDLAVQLGFNDAQALFEMVGKDEYSLRNIETVLRPSEPTPSAEESIPLRKPSAAPGGTRGGVLVVGVDSLLTQLAKCCKPAPPDAISGFVTRGRGVSVHRSECPNLRNMVLRSGDRLVDVEWGNPRVKAGKSAVYPVDVSVQALDRQGLLRDISEVFAKEKMNVIGVQTQTIKGIAWMTFTVEVGDSSRLGKVLHQVGELSGVRAARRR
ncbi:MAG: RelA/SpoT family protein [Rhodoferax sp.]